jgi:predicted DNA-binding transcriptional regulator AlpA
MQLWGPAEVTRELGVSHEALRKWRWRDDFPAPCALLTMGPVWKASEVKAWRERVLKERRKP